MGMTPVLFTAREAAAALEVDRRTIQRWVKTGRIKPLRSAGKAYVFTSEEIVRVGADRALRGAA